MLSRPTMLKLLIEDFRRAHPDANRATVVECYSRLSRLDNPDLELLISQLPAEVLKQMPEKRNDEQA